MVDLEDCDVPMPTPNDFPDPLDIRAVVFSNWIPLCELVGRLSRTLRRKRAVCGKSAAQLAHDLVSWVKSLPPALLPDFKHSKTSSFHRDVHGLHLTYLMAITLLHLNSKDGGTLPGASIAAVAAASCTARIFHDYLVRGSVNFLTGQPTWYAAIAVLALLHARRVVSLTAHADEDIHILRTTLKVMAPKWHSARMFESGIEKLMASKVDGLGLQNNELPIQPHFMARTAMPSSLDHENSLTASTNWEEYFPFATKDTSLLISALMTHITQPVESSQPDWITSSPTHPSHYFMEHGDVSLDFLNL